MKKTLSKFLSTVLVITMLCLLMPQTAFAETYQDFSYTIFKGEVAITGYIGAGGDIVVPNTIEGYPVTDINSHAFLFNSNITSIDLSGNIYYIAPEAFWGCSSLKSIILGRNVDVIGLNAFYGCTSLEKFIVDKNNPYLFLADDILYSRSDRKLIKCPTGKSGTVVIPDNIGIISDSAFESCKNISTVIVGDNVYNIGENAFMNCENLASIYLPNSVYRIEKGVFSECNKLIIYGHSGWTSNTYASNDFPFVDVYSAPPVTSGDYTYYLLGDQAVIQSYIGTGGDIVIPDTLDGYPVIKIGSRAFEGCASITNITISEGIRKIGYMSFADCVNLKKIILPIGMTDILGGAFVSCVSLSSIIIPSSVINFEDGIFMDANTRLTIYASPSSYAQAYATENGLAWAMNNTPGNANGDDVVNFVDLTLLSRYLAKWKDIEINTDTVLDMNCDGTVDFKDVTLLSRNIAGWSVAAD